MEANLRFSQFIKITCELMLTCIGNHGNMLDGRNDPVKGSAATDAADAGDEAPLVTTDDDRDDDDDATDEECHSVTEPAQPLTNDRLHAFMLRLNLG